MSIQAINFQIAPGITLIDVVASDAPTPDQEIVRKDGIARLLAKMLHLPRLQQTIIKGAVAGMSVEQLSELSGKPILVINNLLNSACHQLLGGQQPKSKIDDRRHRQLLYALRKHYRNITNGLTCKGKPRATTRKGAPRKYDYDAIREFHAEHQSYPKTCAKFGITCGPLHRILNMKPRTEPYPLRKTVQARLDLLKVAGILQEILPLKHQA